MFVQPTNTLSHSRRLLACLGVLLLTAVPLYAHHLPPGIEDVDEFEDGAAFMAGLRHPLLGIDHWMFAVAVGAVIILSMRSRRMALGTFLVSMMLGATMGLQGVSISGAAWSGTFALAACGLLFVFRQKEGAAARMGLIAAVALWQGNEHGIVWPLGDVAVAYLAGVLLTTLALALIGAGVVAFARRRLRSSGPMSSQLFH